MNRTERAAVYAALGDEHRLAIVEALLLTDLPSSALARTLEMASNLLAHHVAVLEDAGLLRRRRSDGDGRRRYLSLRTEFLPAELVAPAPAGRVLFTCSRNSARSQLAAALYARHAGRVAESAGVDPGEAIHPKAVAVAAEIGIELSGTPQGYGAVRRPDVVVSVCDLAGEEHVPFGDAVRLHWSIPDPVSEGGIDAFRRTRDILDERVGRLAASSP